MGRPFIDWGTNDEVILIVCRNRSQGSLYFKMKSGAKFKQLFQAFAKHQKLQGDLTRLQFVSVDRPDCPLGPYETPVELNFKGNGEYNVVDVLLRA